jgi:UMF1 family MFS transporter
MTSPLPLPADPAGADTSVATGATSKPLSLGALSWSLHQGARDPYVILITIYIFMPYFSTIMVGDPVKGQTLVAAYGFWSGLFVALTVPLLGASIDRLGPRKPGILLGVILMVPMIFALWWARPDGTGLSITMVMMLTAVISVIFNYIEMLHNSLLVRAAGLQDAHRASGLALSCGNGLSVLALIFVLWAFALPGKVDWPFIPAQPLFGLDPLKHETDRIVAPMSAVIFALFTIPLFLFTPDEPKTGSSFAEALRGGMRTLRGMLGTLRGHRDAAVFLGARMIYVDAMTALLLFSGVYAAGAMHWGVLDMLIFGVTLSVFAVYGGFFGGWLDGRFGPKRAVQIEIMGTILCLLGMLGMRPDRLFYFWAYDPAAHAKVWNGPFFTTLPELLYLFLGFGVAVFVTGSYASSRTLLTRLIPANQTGTFFGLYALSGTATVWLGSLMVQLFTGWFKSQQAGLMSIAGMMLIGFVALWFVKGGQRQVA